VNVLALFAVYHPEAMMEQPPPLPPKSALITVLLMDRPMCLDCISLKAELSTTEADRNLTAIGTSLQLHRNDDRCLSCGRNNPVYSLHR
jgi:hypothetical protein